MVKNSGMVFLGGLKTINTEKLREIFFPTFLPSSFPSPSPLIYYSPSPCLEPPHYYYSSHQFFYTPLLCRLSMLLLLVVQLSQMCSVPTNWQGICWGKFCQVCLKVFLLWHHNHQYITMNNLQGISCMKKILRK